MPDQLVLLPGWAFGPAALQPLCQALSEQSPDLEVVVEPLPELADADAWLDELDRRLPRNTWLAGWSLGGMLATQLAARRGDACRGLLTIASNPCFRARIRARWRVSCRSASRRRRSRCWTRGCSSWRSWMADPR